MNSSYKKFLIPIILMLVFSLISISIGFSSLSTTLSVNGNAAFIPVDMIRFTALETNNLNNAVEEDKSFLINILNFNIELDTINSTATYDVTLSNLGQVDKILTSINNEIYSNDDIQYELNGIGVNTIIRKGEDVHFTITFKYKNNVTIDETRLNAKLKFLFDDYEDIGGTYIVSFDPNGGLGTMQEMQMTIDEYKRLNGNTFYKDGYYFKEWNTSPDGTGRSYRNRENVKNINDGQDTVILYAIWSDELESVEYPGTCEFNGRGIAITGDCADGESDYINTGIAPFSEENYQKSFLLKFTITDVDETRFTANMRDTIFNMLYEANDKIKGIYPGSLLRIEGGRWQLQAGNGKTAATKVQFNKDALIGKEYKLIRYNDGNSIKIYYMIGDGEPQLIRDVTELYAPFDTPLTFGANLQIDNINTDRHAYATLSDISFEFLDDGLTLNDIINGGTVEPEELETVFSVKGPCFFNGNDNITGNKCSDYEDNNYIDTGVYLFDEDTYQEDFELTFELDDYVTSQQIDSQVTIFNAFKERNGLGYGMLLRRNKDKFELIMRDGNGINKMINLNVVNPMFVRIVRKNNHMCYSINDSNLIYVDNFENFGEPFDIPVTFGGSIDKYGEPFRFIKGTLSDMTINMGTVSDACGD